MILHIQLAGIVREIAGKEMIAIELENPQDLEVSLIKLIPELKQYTYRISVNGILLNDFSGIRKYDKIIIFSPIAGG